MRNPKWVITPGLIAHVGEFESICRTTKDRPIMIVGPSGVGKSLFLHIFEELNRKVSKSKKRPVRLNCAALEILSNLVDLRGTYPPSPPFV